jgi:hypothetical protein
LVAVAIGISNGQEVEVVVSGADFEAYPSRPISVHEQDAVAKHTMDEIGGSPVHDDDVDGDAQRLLELGGELERQLIEALGCMLEPQSDVNVACGGRTPARATAEEICGDEAIDSRETLDQKVLKHQRSIARAIDADEPSARR